MSSGQLTCVFVAQKVKERMNSSNVDPTVPGLDSWRRFSQRAQQFENQRLACDSGLAFAFTEGALVDAIRSGKWYVTVIGCHCRNGKL